MGNVSAVLEPGEATWIMPRLWQGSRPQFDAPLDEMGFDAVALCTVEYQPEDRHVRIPTIRAELDDSGRPPTAVEMVAAHRAGRQVAKLWAQGGRVHVTCWLGLNRSGLVTALALCDATGCSGADAVRLIQASRKGTLQNHWFREYLETIPAQAPSVEWTPSAREDLRARAPSLGAAQIVYRPKR